MAKKKKTYKPEEVGMLLEDIDSKVSVIAESHTTLNKKVDDLTKKVDGIAEDVGEIKLDIEFIKNELKQKIGRDKFAVLEKR